MNNQRADLPNKFLEEAPTPVHRQKRGGRSVNYPTQAVWRNEPNFLDGRLFRSTARLIEQWRNRRVRKSTLIASVGRQILPATDTETTPSLLWFATI